MRSACGARVFLRSFPHLPFYFLTRGPPLRFVPSVLVPELSRGLSVLSRSGLHSLPAVYSRNLQMPKKEKASTQAKGQPAAGGGEEAGASGPVVRDRSGAVTIMVHVKPSSKRSAVTDVSAEAVAVAVAAPPTDGEANSELIRYLAEVLDLKKSHLVLDKGSRSRDKLVKVASSLSPEEVLSRLKHAAD